MPTQHDTYRPLPTRQDSLIRAAILGDTHANKSNGRSYEQMHDFLIFNPYQNLTHATNNSKAKK
jgi:hypothetical protein